MRSYRSFFFLPLAIALMLALAAPGQAQSFTLEQAMSSPFPSELIVSRRGDRVAWVFTLRASAISGSRKRLCLPRGN